LKAQTALKQVYDEKADPIEQIDKALLKAENEDKFVICQVGGNWCPWCLRFADFMTKDAAISKMVNENFVFIHTNYNPRNKADATQTKRAEKLMKMLGFPGRFGFPVFVVLNSEGKVLHIQDSGYLEEGNSYDQKKVMRFFQNWTPKAVKGIAVK
jgi:uncharacterized protein YyaL (SSP411 family)